VPGVSLWGGWGAWLRGWESLGWAGWGGGGGGVGGGGGRGGGPRAGAPAGLSARGSPAPGWHLSCVPSRRAASSSGSRAPSSRDAGRARQSRHLRAREPRPGPRARDAGRQVRGDPLRLRGTW
jgi:hypothetical protein